MAEKLEYMNSAIVKDFTKDIQQYNLGPLWEAIPALMDHEPKPHAHAYLWKEELLTKKLMEAAEIFTPDRGGAAGPFIFKPWLNSFVSLRDGL
jgi:gentisate 1,2-dioxygenase